MNVINILCVYLLIGFTIAFIFMVVFRSSVEEVYVEMNLKHSYSTWVIFAFATTMILWPLFFIYMVIPTSKKKVDNDK